MQAVLSSLVAVFGTVLGSVITYTFQRRAAAEAVRAARDEWLLQQRMDAYADFSEVLMEFRAAQYDRWHRSQEDPDGERAAAARDESFRLRAAANHAMFRVRLLAHDARLVRQAAKAVELTADIPKSQDKDALEARGEEARAALETFVEQAAEVLQGIARPTSTET